MSTISASTSDQYMTISKFLGLNECRDGDANLKIGEANVMRNFKITRDQNLATRPGNLTLTGLLRGYTYEESSDLTLFLSESGTAKLNCFNDVYAGYDGKIGLRNKTFDEEGNPVYSSTGIPIDHSMFDEHKGHYVKYNYSNYQLEKCIYNETTSQYEWYGYKVTAVSDSDYEDTNVQGMWSGYINDRREFLAACNGKLWKLFDEDMKDFCKVDLGEMFTDKRVTFLPFNGLCYILNGYEYYVYDGHCIKKVEGYRPLIQITTPPSGGDTNTVLYEKVNRLTGARRVWYSPDGTSTKFVLPETDILTLDWVKTTVDDVDVDVSTYTVDRENGTVTFTSAPAKGVNSIEIAYTAQNSMREQITRMRYYELYSGTGDTRILLYGDGSNQIAYTSLDYNGNLRADYFPDLGVIDIGSANTPVTGIIRHFSALIAFKTDSTYSVEYGTVTDDEGNTSEAFYTRPVNRTIGNCAMGQVQLVLNAPRSLHGKDLYEWKSNSSRTGNLTFDERQAKRISDRIYSSLYDMDVEDAYCFDDNTRQEYYICYDGTALVNNYAVDAWYKYTDLDVNCMCEFDGELYIGTRDGRLMHMSDGYRTNDGEDIDSYWESGSMNFGNDYRRKTATELWVVIKPTSRGQVKVTIQTDRRSDYQTKIVQSSIFDFTSLDFGAVDFNTNNKPHSKRLKLKAKKFVFYKIIFESAYSGTTATVISADVKFRYTGKAK